jgi:hypothetical protein
LAKADDCAFNSAGIVDFLIETRSLPALARRYHRDFAFYVAYPISSSFPFCFILPRRELARHKETKIGLTRMKRQMPCSRRNANPIFFSSGIPRY